MPKKLTLNVDDELINFAHLYSKETGLSISKLFEQYLNKLRSYKNNSKLNPKTNALYGIFNDAPLLDKKELRKIFHEKNSH